MESDVFCTRSRRQAEICRSSVEAVLKSERVSCRAATYICNADTLCGTAYAYYYGLCRRMFLGKKCTKRFVSFFFLPFLILFFSYPACTVYSSSTIHIIDDS